MHHIDGLDIGWLRGKTTGSSVLPHFKLRIRWRNEPRTNQRYILGKVRCLFPSASTNFSSIPKETHIFHNMWFPLQLRIWAMLLCSVLFPGLDPLFHLVVDCESLHKDDSQWNHYSRPFARYPQILCGSMTDWMHSLRLRSWPTVWMSTSGPEKNSSQEYVV